MDKKDRRLLYELTEDSRQSYARLARRVGLTQETVRYRINRLLAQGVIQKFLGVVNTSRLGFSYYQILLRLHNIDEDKKREIIAFLQDSPRVSWVADLEGNYDLAFIVCTRNTLELSKAISTLYDKYSAYISKRTVSVHLSGKFFSRTYLIEQERTFSKEYAYELEGKQTALDDSDSQICKLLSLDGRASAIGMASHLNLSPDAVLGRIKRLQQEGFLTAFTLVLDNQRAGQAHYKILIYLNNLSTERLQAFYNYCKSEQRVIAIIHSLGEWDYEIDLEVQTHEQLRQFIMSLTKVHATIIRDYDLCEIKRIYKYNFYP